MEEGLEKCMKYYHLFLEYRNIIKRTGNKMEEFEKKVPSAQRATCELYAEKYCTFLDPELGRSLGIRMRMEDAIRSMRETEKTSNMQNTGENQASLVAVQKSGSCCEVVDKTPPPRSSPRSPSSEDGDDEKQVILIQNEQLSRKRGREYAGATGPDQKPDLGAAPIIRRRQKILVTDCSPFQADSSSTGSSSHDMEPISPADGISVETQTDELYIPLAGAISVETQTDEP